MYEVKYKAKSIEDYFLMLAWLNVNCIGEYHCKHNKMLEFENIEDALKFKLVWG